MSLTGRFDFQITFTGKLVLLVEEEVPKMFKRGTGSQAMRKRWRPAKAIDLSVPAMRPLIDLRGAAGKRPFTPQLVAVDGGLKSEPTPYAESYG
jgi:hypothetical protein